MCKIIAIANQKGGVGKTTTTSNLGIGLAKQGKRVLLIDADAQGSLTASLGFKEPDKLEITLANVLANIINDEEMDTDYGILKHEEGIDLMPGNIELSGLEVSLMNVMSREVVLSSYVEMVKDRYDYILIDCMPSLGMITINAFACADSILIPVQAAYLPVKGLEQLIKTIGKVKRQINPKLEIEGMTNKSLPMPITVKPYLHQQQAFDFACMRFGLLPSDFRSNGVALLMEMGTGKTITSIGISGILYQFGSRRRAESPCRSIRQNPGADNTAALRSRDRLYYRKGHTQIR